MLKLIYGLSGAGKTDTLLKSIREDIAAGKRCYLLVPEQQAYISERDIPSLLPKNAGLFFEVVNFSALADTVFRKHGGIAHPTSDTALSSLIMWNTLRILAPNLKQYGKSGAVDSALTALMLSTVAELRSCGITADSLEEAACDTRTSLHLANKLSDIALIDSVYRAKTQEAFGGDPADKLERLADKLKKHDFFKNCNIYVDSFTGFTAPEYDILEALLKQAENVTIALCADRFHSSFPHFSGINKTDAQLSKIAQRIGCKVERSFPLSAPAEKPMALRLLSDRLWDFSIRREDLPEIPQKEQECVQILSAPNLYEEAEAAALHVCELVQSGMNYRDIAVIVRDAEVYRGVLDAAFERYKIPYFLSERTDLSSKPLSRLILCALRTAAHHFRREDVISLLKTGLCGIPTREAALFEEYCDTWHISGKRFTEELWSMNPDGLTPEISERGKEILKSANEVRARLIPPLVRLGTDLRASKNLQELCTALYDYLHRTEIPLRLSEIAKKELSLGQRREAAETVRLYSRVTELLTTLCRLLPDTAMNADEFISALSLLLSNTDLGSVPNVQDCVMIGSASMLRVENVRASLLLGLCEGEFPAAISDDGVFTDSDKTFLEGMNIVFSSETKLRNSEELFYVYRAIAKPSERLFLSTVAKQPDGSARTPSLAFQRACFLLRRKPEVFNSSEAASSRTRLATESTDAILTAPPAKTPTELYLSQTRITTFVQCPYLHYLKYGLTLREPKDSNPSYADDGTFLHYVFEHFLRASLGEDNQLHIPPEEAVEPLADRIISEYLSDTFPGGTEWMGERLMHLYARLRRLALLMLREIMEEIEQSPFVPSQFEMNIGKRGKDSLPPVTIRLKDGSSVHLTGKIDRVDLCKSDDTVYVRVVDYKSGEHKFSVDDIASGLDMQLILYLFAYLSAVPKAKAYGAQYVYTKNVEGVPGIMRSGFYLAKESEDSTVPVVDALYTKTLSSESADGIAEMQKTLCKTVSTVAERMLSGEAEKTPSEAACKFCPIRHVCDRAYHKGKE